MCLLEYLSVILIIRHIIKSMLEYFLKEEEFCSFFIQALVYSDTIRKKIPLRHHLFLISLILISFYVKTISKNNPYYS